MSANDLDKQWYLLKGREVLGPYSGHVIRDMLRDRRVGADAMVALPGSSDWQPISILANAPGAAPQAPAIPGGAPQTPVSHFDTGYRHYAGFWIRVGAYLLDALIIFVPLSLLITVPLSLMGLTQDPASSISVLLNLVLGLIFIVYSAILTAGRWQATLGKRICGIHVIHETGAPISIGRAIGRVFCYYLDGLTFCIGYVLAGVTKEKTALHDMICQTRVIYGRK